MTTKVMLLNSAYSLMRISGLTVQPTPEDIEVGLYRLEDLMAEFWGRTLDFNYQFEDEPDPNTESGVALVHRHMVASNLATVLCIDFGKDVPLKLQAEATQSFTASSAVIARERVREVAYPARMPRGAGNRRFNRWRRFYPSVHPPVTDASNEKMFTGDIDDFVESFANFLSTNGGQIDGYDIQTTRGLSLISSSLDANKNTVNYRLEALETGILNSRSETVTVTIITTQGRKESRERIFEIAPLTNTTTVSPSVPPVPPSLFSATIMAIDFSTPMQFSADLDFTVDWGNGTRIEYNGGDTANGTAMGIVTFQSSFAVKTATFDGSGAQSIDVTESSTLLNMDNMFSGQSNVLTINIADTSNVTTMNSAFGGCAKLTAVPFMDTAQVISMAFAFANSPALTTIPALDFSAVQNFQQGFEESSGLTSLPAFNTSSMQFCGAMFRDCVGLVCLTSIDMSVTQVGFTSLMFDNCPSLVAPDATDQNDISFNRNSWTNPAPCP